MEILDVPDSFRELAYEINVRSSVQASVLVVAFLTEAAKV